MRVLIADDHPLFRTAIRAMLGRVSADAEIVEASDYAEARVRLSAATYDAALVDLMMPGADGLHSVAELVGHAGETKVLVVSGMNQANLATDLRALGAAGYVAKTAPVEHIVEALKAVMAGGTAFPAAPAATAIRPADNDDDGLTPKQRQVFELLADGHTNKKIAEILNASPNTVKAHVAEIFHKLGVSSRAQIIVRKRAEA